MLVRRTCGAFQPARRVTHYGSVVEERRYPRAACVGGHTCRTQRKLRSDNHGCHQRNRNPEVAIFRTVLHSGNQSVLCFRSLGATADVDDELGIILALNHLYDNWTIAGVMSAAYVLSTAAVTPLYARLFDRFGQRKVGSVVLVVQIIAMLGFAFAALVRVPIPLLFALLW